VLVEEHRTKTHHGILCWYRPVGLHIHDDETHETLIAVVATMPSADAEFNATKLAL
jgi:hypothetical protein